MFRRDDRVALVRRALTHLRDRTTDQAPEPMRVPVGEFLDPQVWRADLDLIFRRRPLALALSAELRESGDYKAMEVIGLPVLIVRGFDGEVRAFLNACRHRGAQLCPPGTGNRRRFRCPYHAWVYDDEGALVAILREETFGDIDHAGHGLRALPAAERHGIVWVTPTPGAASDVDEWLGDFGPVLAELDLGSWHVHRHQELPGPNWKLTYDGYLEGYHFQTLHKRTFGTNSITNLMVADSFGPHQRVVFATKALPRLLDLPEPEWDLGASASPIYTVFPNVSIAGSWHDHAMVSQILPGTTIDRHETAQIILTRHRVTTDEDRRAADGYAELMLRGTRDEDYVVAYGAWAALGSGANTHLTLGRNEIALQHQHRWLERLAGRA